MKRLLLYFILVTSVSAIHAQTVTTDPAIPVASQPLTITVDVTGTSLAGYTGDVWIWTWIEEGCPSSCDAPTNINPATSVQDAAKVTRIGGNLYQITFTPTIFFNKPVAQLNKIGLKLKSRDWADNKQTDNNRFIELFTGFVVTFSQPATFPLFKDQGETITITANTSEASDLTLYVDGASVATEADATSVTHTHTINESPGAVEVSIEADNGIETKTASFQYIVRAATTTQDRPAGIIDGINYHTDPTKATLSLWAPAKLSSVYAIGDFSGWQIDPAYQMKKDGEHFWIELTGLTPGQEYAFQYLIDESIYVADPYADKILDPDDQYIPAATYPDLKAFPAEARKDQSYFNRLAVLQTAQQPYTWQVTNFQKPPKEKLVVYELLIRDFFGSGAASYQNLIDTLGYLRKLGVNAIELMPIMEFNGNESWGYNPTFMFAPDKFYGTKNKLKEFVDKCHQQGIAVILDIAMNHQDIPNPYVLMDYDFAANKPQADNKWFNVNATHPFNVFFDMNHESPYTQKYLDTVNHYWLNEFKVDGFRFDLSKGFTQTNHPNDVGLWSAYDASRIALLKRMADKLWSHSPDAYVILEHLSENSEEKELAEYRANEGKGMMLWGKMTEPYNENTMGYSPNSNLDWIMHTTRGWNVPHVVGYMESHDEERLMYKNVQYGKNGSGHNTKTVPVALKRMAAAATIFYTIPGPKMLWQFGELGYDFSINHCPDGSNSNDCRVSPKPVKWEYREDEQRYALYEHISDLNRLRRAYDVFTSGTASLPSGNNLVKQLILKNEPYTATPSTTDQMNVVVVVNFDVAIQTVTPGFPHTGSWYDYYEGGRERNVTAGYQLTLLPGEYKLFTDVTVASSFVTGAEERPVANVSVYPNPTSETLFIDSGGQPVRDLNLSTLQGQRIPVRRIDQRSWDIRHLPTGIYIAEVRTASRSTRVKVVKK